MLIQVSEHLLANFKEDVQCRAVMVFPGIVDHFIVELLIVILPIAEVEDQIVVFVLRFKELGYVFDSVSVRLLET